MGGDTVTRPEGCGRWKWGGEGNSTGARDADASRADASFGSRRLGPFVLKFVKESIEYN